jgi:chemotaxis protein CheD
MVLPDSSAARNGTGGPRFVDIAVPLVVEAMGALGAIRGRLRVQLAGGAHVLALQGDGHQIGGRNVEAAIRALARLHLHAKYDQTGGSRGRTVTLAVATGEVTIATAGAGAAAG